MIVDCLSDLHGDLPHLDGGDLLIVAGDLTANDSVPGWRKFFRWLKKQNYKKKVYIAGNHDGFLKNCLNSNEVIDLYLCTGANDVDLEPNDEFEYLRDSGTEFGGLKIFGSPWTPPFCDWHFMLPPDQIKAKWDLIPNDTDILITHGPPFGILDTPEINGKRCGCPHLREALERVKPQLHVFGHIHGSYGQIVLKHHDAYIPQTLCVNASHMDENYQPVNKPIRVIL